MYNSTLVIVSSNALKIDASCRNGTHSVLPDASHRCTHSLHHHRIHRFHHFLVFVHFPLQDSRRSSSTACGRAPGGGTQGGPAHPGSFFQREGGSESQRRPADRRVPAGSSDSAGHIRRICEWINNYEPLLFQMWSFSFFLHPL